MGIRGGAIQAGPSLLGVPYCPVDVHTIVLHTRKLGSARAQAATKIPQNRGCTQHLKEPSAQLFRYPPHLGGKQASISYGASWCID
jgi:hypothetical protein